MSLDGPALASSGGVRDRCRGRALAAVLAAVAVDQSRRGCAACRISSTLADASLLASALQRCACSARCAALSVSCS